MDKFSKLLVDIAGGKISNDFIDISLINRHKMIYNALSALIKKEIHAISISARTVDE